MKDVHQLCKGASKAAWGYFFLFFNMDINGFQILPDFIGYLLFLGAIRLLEEEERELSLLRGFCTILLVDKLIEWFLSFYGAELGAFWALFGFVCDLLALYFQFQFLTNLASIAARYQPAGTHTDQSLLNCRTFLTVFQTVLTLCGLFLQDFIYLVNVRYTLIALLILNGLTGLVMMFKLFKLRRVLANAASPLVGASY